SLSDYLHVSAFVFRFLALFFFLLLFFFTAPAPTDIYTLSLHDALPILMLAPPVVSQQTQLTSRPKLFYLSRCHYVVLDSQFVYLLGDKIPLHHRGSHQSLFLIKLIYLLRYDQR